MVVCVEPLTGVGGRFWFPLTEPLPLKGDFAGALGTWFKTFGSVCLFVFESPWSCSVTGTGFRLVNEELLFKEDIIRNKLSLIKLRRDKRNHFKKKSLLMI